MAGPLLAPDRTYPIGGEPLAVPPEQAVRALTHAIAPTRRPLAAIVAALLLASAVTCAVRAVEPSASSGRVPAPAPQSSPLHQP